MHVTYSDKTTHLRYIEHGCDFHIAHTTLGIGYGQVHGTFSQKDSHKTIACFMPSSTDYVLVQQTEGKKQAARRYLWYRADGTCKLDLACSADGFVWRYVDTKVLLTENWIVGWGEDASSAILTIVPKAIHEHTIERYFRIPARCIQCALVDVYEPDTLYAIGYDPAIGLIPLKIRLPSIYNPEFSFEIEEPLKVWLDRRLTGIERVVSATMCSTYLVLGVLFRSTDSGQRGAVLIYDTQKQALIWRMNLPIYNEAFCAYYDCIRFSTYIVTDRQVLIIKGNDIHRSSLRDLFLDEAVCELVAIQQQNGSITGWWVIDNAGYGSYYTDVFKNHALESDNARHL